MSFGEGARHSNGIIAVVSAETMQLAREGLEAVAGFPPKLQDGTLRYTRPRARQFHRTHTPRRVSVLA